MTRAQWQIAMPQGEHDDEWDQLDRAKGDKSVQAHDNVAERKTVIYGPRGEALVEQTPRPIGFRPRR